MHTHHYYALKLKALLESINHWSLVTDEQRARAKYFSHMMRLAQEGIGDE